MDIKFVLSSILREAERCGAKGEAKNGVRLIDAVNGERGEGYWLLYPETLVLLYRKLGERDYYAEIAPPAEWEWRDYAEEKYRFSVVLSRKGKDYRCAFSPAERVDAEVVMARISHDREAAAAPLSETLVLLGAGLLLAAQLSGGITPEQDHQLDQLIEPRVRAAGMRYLTANGESGWTVEVAERFSRDQKFSLLLNMLDLVMADGDLTGEERSTLKRVALAVGETEDEYAILENLMVLKNQCPMLFE